MEGVSQAQGCTMVQSSAGVGGDVKADVCEWGAGEEDVVWK